MMRCLVIVAIGFACFTTSANDSVDDAAQQLEELQTKIELKRRQINEKKKQKASAERSLGRVSRDLKYTKYKLRKAKKELSTLALKVTEARQRLQTLEKDYLKSHRTFMKRLKQIYKTQNLGFIEFLIEPSDFFSESQTRYFFEKIVENDITMIRRLKAKKTTLINERKRLESKEKRAKTLERTIQKQEKAFMSKQRQKKNVVSSLSEQIKQSEREADTLERASKEITQFLLKSGVGDDGYYAHGSFIKPVKGWLSSRYGYRIHPISKRRLKHNGIDLAAPTGYKIRAANTGVVKAAGYKKAFKGYGKVTVIDHGKRPSDKKRIATVYAHQSRILVKEGQVVNKGDVIGLVGSTGYSTGPHLHLEVRINGVPSDPLKIIKL